MAEQRGWGALAALATLPWLLLRAPVRAHAWPVVICTLASGLACWLGARWLKAGRPPPDWRILGGSYVAIRAAVLAAGPPSLSDDVWRYLWEGRIQWWGWNPFLVAPDDPRLTPLRDGIWPLINHPELSAIYPGAVQLAGRVLAPGGLGLLLAAIIMLELAVIGGVARLLGAERRGWLLCLIWSPVLILEGAHGAHLPDWLQLGALVALLLGAERGRRWAPAAWSGVAAASKIFGGGFALFLARDELLRTPGRRQWIGAAAVLALAILVATGLQLPYLGPWEQISASARAYGQHWSFGGPLYGVLEPLVGGVAARLVGLGLLAGLGLWCLFRAPLLGCLGWMGWGLLWCSPTVYPWYGLLPAVLAPLLLARGRRPGSSCLWLSATLPLSYLVLRHPWSWHSPPLAQALIWLPAALLTAWRGPADHDPRVAASCAASVR